MFKYFSTYWKWWDWSVVSKEIVDHFSFFLFVFWTGTILAFFYSNGEFPPSKLDVKIISRGLHIYEPHIFNIRLLILWWACAFSQSKFWIIFRMPSLAKVVLDRLNGLKQKLRRKTAAVINYSGLLFKKRAKYFSRLFKIIYKPGFIK